MNIYNPILLNSNNTDNNQFNDDNDLHQFIFHNECINSNSENECPVCLENIDTVLICFPFVCRHLICIECFNNLCNLYSNFNNRINKIACPICRNKTNNFWRLGKCIKKSKIKKYIVISACKWK